MNMDILQKSFMSACGQSLTTVNFKQIELYQELIREELVKELFPALEAWLADPLDIEKVKAVLDGIGDTEVVLKGLAYSMGVDPGEIKKRIDISNYSKIPQGQNQANKRADGKILKPATYVPPELDDLAEKVIANIAGVK